MPEASLFSLPTVKEPVRVAFDGVDDLWIVDLSGNLTLYSPTGRSFPIVVGGLASGDVIRAAVPSRDGTRAALLVESGPRTNLLLARIVRTSPTGRVGIEVQEPIRVESKLVEVVELLGRRRPLAVLGSESGNAWWSMSASVGDRFPRVRARVSRRSSRTPTLVAAADGVIYDNTSERGPVASMPRHLPIQVERAKRTERARAYRRSWRQRRRSSRRARGCRGLATLLLS